MYTIDLVNVQAISKAHIEFKDNTIVEFIGDNSNGKSILSKVVEALTKNDLKDKETRMSLIKDGTEQAVILFTHNQEQLGIILEQEVSKSYILYIPNKDNDSVRYVRCINDKEGCDAMIKKFGFRVYSDGDICLQLSPTFGAVPFVTTGGGTNYDIVQDITTDKVAEEFLKTFKTITFPVLKARTSNLKSQRDSAQSILDNLEVYDWKEYERLAEELNLVYRELEHANLFCIEPIPIPDLSFVPNLNFEIKPIPIIEVYNFCKPIEDLGQALSDYLSIYNGVCPTCKRRLFSNAASR